MPREDIRSYLSYRLQDIGKGGIILSANVFTFHENKIPIFEVDYFASQLSLSVRPESKALVGL
jgi:hypothetical protein